MVFPYTLTNGTLADADEVMANLKYAKNNSWYKIIYASNISYGLIKFSSTIWQSENVRTTDAGATWSGSGYGAGYSADTNGVNGASMDAGSPGTAKYTTDSGATWNASSTAPPNANDIAQIHMFSDTIVVAGGRATSGKWVWYSSDGGDNWSQSTTGPVDDVYAIQMASITIGYLVDQDGSIWKTTDGGDNWVDTTDDFSITNDRRLSITCVDTDTLLLAGNSKSGLQKYVNSTNTVSTLYTASTAASAVTNWVKSTNGNYYIVLWYTGGNSGLVLDLLKYDGSDVYLKPLVSALGISDNPSSPQYWSELNNFCPLAKPVLIEVSDILYFNWGVNAILDVNVEEE